MGMARLLLVEDDPDVADPLVELLRAEGHTVWVARNGKEGLALLEVEKPELIICDVEMPVLSGPDMAWQVFLRDAGSELIPILLISGVAELHLVAQKVGTSYFLGKPFTVEKLLAKLALALTERAPPHPKLATDDREVSP
jgi:CheY-like chemotaxis protein